MWAKISEKVSYLNKDGLTIKGASQYLCEEAADIDRLPTDKVTVGSSAVVIPTGEVYLLGPSRRWIKYNGVAVFNDSDDNAGF